MKKIAVITGTSGGIGRCTSELFIKKGYKVYGLSRSGPHDDKIIHISTDISSEQSVINAFNVIKESENKIDVLVNNAGFGISGAVEHTDIGSAKQLFDVNFFGAVNCIKKALPLLRAAESGRIINVSSIAAVLPVPYQAFYSSVKSALNSLTLALANEVSPFGIKVIAVMPGDVKTGFTAARKKNTVSENIYKQAEDRAVKRMEKDEQNGMPPEKVAACVYKAAVKKHPRVFYSVGFIYRVFALLSKILPTGLVNKIEGKMYG